MGKQGAGKFGQPLVSKNPQRRGIIRKRPTGVFVKLHAMMK
ncbi:MAG TPA: hypothetical protein VFD58_37020 [Blastocatellia bacterium]|nr:hypothetical protein [Blastocatellia bacterium]